MRQCSRGGRRYLRGGRRKVKLQATHFSGRSAATVLALAAASLFASCSGTVSRKPAIEIFNDMRQQPKYYPQGESAFTGFNDGRAERRPIPGTIRHPAY